MRTPRPSSGKVIKYGSYYVTINESSDEFLKVLNPHFATIFATDEEAKEWLATYTDILDTGLVRCEICDARAECQKFDQWFRKGMVMGRERKVDLHYSRLYNGESPKEILRWHVETKRKGTKIKHEHYHSWPELFEVFKILHHINVYREDVMTVAIAVKRDSLYEDFASEIELAAPFVTMKEDDGSLVIDVMDRFLAEGFNIVQIVCHPDDTYSLYDVRVRYPVPILERVSLREVFDDLQRNRYME